MKSSSKLSMLFSPRSCSVHLFQSLVQKLGLEVLAVVPRDRREAVVQVELREAIAVPKRLHFFGVKLVGQVDHALAPIVEFQPDLVITEIPRLNHMPGCVLVTGQLGCLLSRRLTDKAGNPALGKAARGTSIGSAPRAP